MNLLFEVYWLLFKGYLRVVGSLTAYTLGVIDRYSAEHRRFLASGFVCGGCHETLIRKYHRWPVSGWVADAECYGPQGEEVPLLQARKKGSHFACPKCSYRWAFRKADETRAA